MTQAEAFQLLDLPNTAGPQEIEARFNELRSALELKITQAATPGLEAKYRSALSEVTTAFETLTLAADSASLPVLGKIAPAGSVPSSPSGNETAHSSAPSRRPSARLMVLLAVTVLVAGGFGWSHWQEQRNEALRIAAAHQAEADRLAREQAEADRLAREQAEQERLAAEQKRQAEEAEQARQDKLTAEMHALLSKLKHEWTRRENRVADAERTLSELHQLSGVITSMGSAKVRELNYFIEAQTRFMAWLDRYFARHPAMLAGIRAEEALKARQPDAAKTALEEMAKAMAEADVEIERENARLAEWQGTLDLKSDPEGLAWSMTDNFGYSQNGVTPAKIMAAPGTAQVVIKRPLYEDAFVDAVISTGETTPVLAVVKTQEVRIQAEDDVQILINGEVRGVGTARLQDAPPGDYKIELRRARHPPYRSTITVRQVSEPALYRYSFSALAREDRKCSPCSGKGRIERSERCSACNGRGGYTCTNCRGRGFFTTPNGELRMNCRICGGDGHETCGQCTRGRVRSSESCRSCGGDGRVSQLQLSQSAK